MHHILPLSILFSLLSLLPLATAHAKIPILHGNHGGNGSALGILGGVIPSLGANSAVEVDGTIFSNQEVRTDGLGRTPKGGPIKKEDLAQVLEMSGGVLPLVGVGKGRDGGEEEGWVMGKWRVISNDGAGPIYAIIDPAATGAFATGINASVTLQVPGKLGRIWPNGTVPRSISSSSPSSSFPGPLTLSIRNLVGRIFRRNGGDGDTRRMVEIEKRAPRTDLEFPFRVTVPKDVVCKGEVAGQKGVCFMKIANSHRNGPFGGVVAFQVKNTEGEGNRMRRKREFVA